MRARVLVLVFAIFVVANASFAEAFPSTQTVGIKSADFKLHDTARNKDVPVRVVYPESGGKLPVIVFSHGAGASGDDYTGLTDYWAEHGYVCLQPTHADSLEQQKEAGRNVTLFRALWDSSVSPDAWVNRMKDVTLLLDSLDAIEKQVPTLKGRIDREKIGVGGHSFGAFVAQALGGALVQFPGETQPKSMRDPRVKAVVLLSPQGTGKVGLVESSWKSFDLPMIVMTGSRDYGDWKVTGRDKEKASPEWRTDAYRFSPPGNKFLYFIKDASHMSFTGVVAMQPTNPLAKRSELLGINEKAIFEWVRMGTLAFWDTYLKNEKSAQKYLADDELAKVSNGSIKIDRK